MRSFAFIRVFIKSLTHGVFVVRSIATGNTRIGIYFFQYNMGQIRGLSVVGRKERIHIGVGDEDRTLIVLKDTNFDFTSIARAHGSRVVGNPRRRIGRNVLAGDVFGRIDVLTVLLKLFVRMTRRYARTAQGATTTTG